MPRPRAKTLLTGLTLLLCAAILWWAYDSFQSRYLRTFDNQTALFAGDNLHLPADLAGPGPIRVCTSGTRPARAMLATNSTWVS